MERQVDSFSVIGGIAAALGPDSCPRMCWLFGRLLVARSSATSWVLFYGSVVPAASVRRGWCLRLRFDCLGFFWRLTVAVASIVCFCFWSRPCRLWLVGRSKSSHHILILVFVLKRHYSVKLSGCSMTELCFGSKGCLLMQRFSSKLHLIILAQVLQQPPSTLN